MKYVLYVATLSLFISFFSACEQDTYEKGTGRYSMMQAELVEAYASDSLLLSRVVTDDGVELRLAPPCQVRWATKTDTAYRALLYYNKVEGGAEPMGCSQIPTAVILPLDSFKKGVRQDPVRFESAWVSKTGRYLNTSIYLLTGEPQSEKARHLMAIADDGIVLNADSSRTQRLRLYHNRGDMPEYYSQRTYISIPLHNVRADSVCFTVQTYDGVVSKTLKMSRP